MVLENTMDEIDHGVAKSWTWLSNFHFNAQPGSLGIWASLFCPQGDSLSSAFPREDAAWPPVVTAQNKESIQGSDSCHQCSNQWINMTDDTCRNQVFPAEIKSIRQSCCCCSVAQLCLTLCNPVDCSTPVSSVLQYLPEFAHIHVHWVSDVIQPPHPLPFASPFAFNLPPLKAEERPLPSSFHLLQSCDHQTQVLGG